MSGLAPPAPELASRPGRRPRRAQPALQPAAAGSQQAPAQPAPGLTAVEVAPALAFAAPSGGQAASETAAAAERHLALPGVDVAAHSAGSSGCPCSAGAGAAPGGHPAAEAEALAGQQALAGAAVEQRAAGAAGPGPSCSKKEAVVLLRTAQVALAGGGQAAAPQPRGACAAAAPAAPGPAGRASEAGHPEGLDYWGVEPRKRGRAKATLVAQLGAGGWPDPEAGRRLHRLTLCPSARVAAAAADIGKLWRSLVCTPEGDLRQAAKFNFDPARCVWIRGLC
jgi:hypothetical protein